MVVARGVRWDMAGVPSNWETRGCGRKERTAWVVPSEQPAWFSARVTKPLLSVSFAEHEPSHFEPSFGSLLWHLVSWTPSSFCSVIIWQQVVLVQMSACWSVGKSAILSLSLMQYSRASMVAVLTSGSGRTQSQHVLAASHVALVFRAALWQYWNRDCATPSRVSVERQLGVS